eukprot:1157271-Pelagomonas_calceolata.AAC.7
MAHNIRKHLPQISHMRSPPERAYLTPRAPLAQLPVMRSLIPCCLHEVFFLCAASTFTTALLSLMQLHPSPHLPGNVKRVVHHGQVGFVENHSAGWQVDPHSHCGCAAEHAHSPRAVGSLDQLPLFSGQAWEDNALRSGQACKSTACTDEGIRDEALGKGQAWKSASGTLPRSIPLKVNPEAHQWKRTIGSTPLEAFCSS